MVWREPCTEGSKTAKVGTDEQERHRRLWQKDEYAQQYDVRNRASDAQMSAFVIVDVAGIDGRKMLLPKEVLK